MPSKQGSRRNSVDRRGSGQNSPPPKPRLSHTNSFKTFFSDAWSDDSSKLGFNKDEDSEPLKHYDEMSFDDMQQWATICSHGHAPIVNRESSVWKDYVKTTKEDVEKLPAALRGSPNVILRMANKHILDEQRAELGILCPMHQGMNYSVASSLIGMLKRFINDDLDQANKVIQTLPNVDPRVKEWLSELHKTKAMWLGVQDWSRLYPFEDLPPIWTTQVDGCHACILARFTERPGVICALKTWMQFVQPRVEHESARLRYVNAMLKTHSDAVWSRLHRISFETRSSLENARRNIEGGKQFKAHKARNERDAEIERLWYVESVMEMERNLNDSDFDTTEGQAAHETAYRSPSIPHWMNTIPDAPTEVGHDIIPDYYEEPSPRHLAPEMKFPPSPYVSDEASNAGYTESHYAPTVLDAEYANKPLPPLPEGVSPLGTSDMNNFLLFIPKAVSPLNTDGHGGGNPYQYTESTYDAASAVGRTPYSKSGFKSSHGSLLFRNRTTEPNSTGGPPPPGFTNLGDLASKYGLESNGVPAPLPSPRSFHQHTGINIHACATPECRASHPPTPTRVNEHRAPEQLRYDLEDQKALEAISEYQDTTPAPSDYQPLSVGVSRSNAVRHRRSHRREKRKQSKEGESSSSRHHRHDSKESNREHRDASRAKPTEDHRKSKLPPPSLRVSRPQMQPRLYDTADAQQTDVNGREWDRHTKITTFEDFTK